MSNKNSAETGVALAIPAVTLPAVSFPSISLPSLSYPLSSPLTVSGMASDDAITESISRLRDKILKQSLAIILGGAASAALEGYSRYSALKRSQLDYSVFDINDSADSRIENWKANFVSILKSENVEYGFSTSSEIFLRRALEDDSPKTDSAIQDIFVHHYGDEKVLVNLLRTLADVESPKLATCCRVLVMGSMPHHSLEVKETALRVVEYWGDKELAAAIGKMKLAPGWLDKYAKKIVAKVVGGENGLLG